MNHSYVVLVLCAVIACDATDIHRLKRSISLSRISDATIPRYVSYSTPYKYDEIRINPIHGPPVQFRGVKPPFDQLPTAALSPESLRQLQILQYISAYVPETDQLNESDFIPLLPYVDSISDDSLHNIQNFIHDSDHKKSSKILKIINTLLAIKERKLKPIKKVVNVGAALVRKKGEKLKDIVWKLTHPFSFGTTTEKPFVIFPGVSVLGDEPHSASVQAASAPTVVDNRFVQFSGTEGGSYFGHPSLAPSYQSIVVPHNPLSPVYGFESPLVTQYNRFSNQHSLVPRIGADLSGIVNTNNDLTFSASENVEQTRYREFENVGNGDASPTSTTERNDDEKETRKGFFEMESSVNSQIKSIPISSTKSPSAVPVYPGTTDATSQNVMKLTVTNESNKVDKVQS